MNITIYNQIKEMAEKKFNKHGCYVTCKNGNGLSVETNGNCDLEVIKCKNCELYELDVNRMMDYLGIEKEGDYN